MASGSWLRPCSSPCRSGGWQGFAFSMRRDGGWEQGSLGTTLRASHKPLVSETSTKHASSHPRVDLGRGGKSEFGKHWDALSVPSCSLPVLSAVKSGG